MKKTGKKPRGGANKALRWQDPFLKREQEKYGQPLPSREFILQLVEEAGEPVPMEDMAFNLGLEPEEHDAFRNRLGAMQRDAQLVINRRGLICLPDKIELKAGRVEGHADGYGFFVPDDRSGDMFLSEREMHQVLHGDRVMVRESGTDRRGRKEGKIVEVLQRANTHVVGRFYREHGHQWVIAENPRINQDIVVFAGEEMQAKQGQVVTIEVVEQPTKHTPPMGRITEVLGNYADPGMEIEIALRKHELPFEFSKATLAQAHKLPKGVVPTDLVAGREDVRHLPLVTIDGEDARDFDDAVYCESLGRSGYKLYVAIADVSHYVRPGEPLDRDAYERGTSVYFPRRVIPMLPEELSNGLCSLNPEVDRLCMMCEMEISSAGKIKQYRFYPAVMHSKARLTYNLVWSWLSGEARPGQEQAWLLPHLQDLYKLFKTLLKARWVRGAIDFETVETKMVFDEQGKIANIVPTSRNDAHRVIEECMLAANVCASDYLQKRKHPALYRVHEGPTPEKLKALQEFMAEFGFYLGGEDEPHAKDYAELLNRIKGRPDEQLLQTVMLRSLKQAMYSPDNVGHFGLAYESYTHFTSPIRRYPDLLVHRAIKACLNDEHYQPGNWEAIGLHCSTTERRADEASRDVVNWLKCYYMQDRIGEEYDGVISGVTGFGVFVALNDVFVEGLVHVSDLGQDYFHFDQSRHQMLGERTSKRYRLGDAVRIRVVRVDLDSAKIDFTLAEESRQAKGAMAKPEAEATAKPKKAAPSKATNPAKEAKAPVTQKASADKKAPVGKKTGKAK